MEVEASKELSKLGVEALKELLQSLIQAKQFAIAQAPDVCQQMVTWALAKGILALGVMVVVVCGSLYVCRLLWPMRDSDGDPVGKVISCLLVIPASAWLLGTLFVNYVAVALQAYVAPKLFLIEEIRKLL